jgi:hypothetical protein
MGCNQAKLNDSPWVKSHVSADAVPQELEFVEYLFWCADLQDSTINYAQERIRDGWFTYLENKEYWFTETLAAKSDELNAGKAGKPGPWDAYGLSKAQFNKIKAAAKAAEVEPVYTPKTSRNTPRFAGFRAEDYQGQILCGADGSEEWLSKQDGREYWCWINTEKKRGGNNLSVFASEQWVHFNKNQKVLCHLDDTATEKARCACLNAAKIAEFFRGGAMGAFGDATLFDRITQALQGEYSVADIEGHVNRGAYDVATVMFRQNDELKVVSGSKRKTNVNRLTQKEVAAWLDATAKETDGCILHHGAGMEMALLANDGRCSSRRVCTLTALARRFGYNQGRDFSWSMDFLCFLIHPSQDRAIHRATRDCRDEALVLRALFLALAALPNN